MQSTKRMGNGPSMMPPKADSFYATHGIIARPVTLNPPCLGVLALYALRRKHDQSIPRHYKFLILRLWGV